MNKTTQFTPGPWVVDEDYEDEEQQAIGIVKEGHGYIAGIHILASSNNGEGFTSEDRANARLIAAAPELLAALNAASEWLNDMGCEHEEPDLTCVVCLVNIAIDKAEGR